jgi:hypothetical protein
VLAVEREPFATGVANRSTIEPGGNTIAGLAAEMELSTTADDNG